MSTQTDVLIVGGGVSGLSVAWWLAQTGLPVEVWEADARPGGKIESHRQDGYLTERAASLLVNHRPEVVQLVRQTGLENSKVLRGPLARSRRYLLHQGELVPLPMRLGALVRSPLWTWRGKLRLLAEPFIPAGHREDESVSEFITRRLGREMLDQAMEPFVAGTLAADPDRACAASTLPRLTALERRYGSLAAGVLAHKLLRRRTACAAETFSFDGGMGALVNTLAHAPNVYVRPRHSIIALEPDNDGWRVTADTPYGARTVCARQVVLTTPAPTAAKLLEPLDTEIAELLRGIAYAPIMLAHLGFDRAAVGHALDGAGFLTPRSEAPVLTGNLWMSTLFPGRAPAGKVLLTAYLGGARAPQVANWNEQRVIDEALGALRRLLGIKADPEMVRVDAHREALPLYYGAYQARMTALAARLQGLPGLHLEGSYRGGVSVRDRIACGRAVAKRIIQQLCCTPPEQTTQGAAGCGIRVFADCPSLRAGARHDVISI